MNDDREAILGRIAEALRVPAPAHHEAHSKPGTHSVTAPFREWLPPVGASQTARIELFAKLSDVLRTEFKKCTTVSAAAKHLAALAKEGGWKTLAFHPGELTDAVAEFLPDSLARLRLVAGYDRDALEACEAGLTECESLVAQTGSVCVTARSSGGRTLSVLPHHHIVLARKEQLVSDLAEAYERLAQKYGGTDYPSFVGFISGPSRTGDIERILVLGAHGPKRLTVLLVP
ncbi:MAG: L-lactate dehydrogenase complex protein LldG [Chthoniobacter sp.]|jgi:L-lactate dehydrogenase complex protein LldG|nr:L-lactate dehydrogenase complex protein LldG [Chthoniobacter sp.]